MEEQRKSENALVPALRFEGFSDPWEQRKLGEFAEIVGGGTPSTNVAEYWDGDIDWYSPAELGERTYADSSLRKITQAGYESCSAKMLPADRTILFTSRAGIGNTAILRRSGCTNQGFQSLIVNEKAVVYFIYSMSDKIKRYAEQRSSGSTFLEISGKRLAAGVFAFPDKGEQARIGALFQKLDSLIALHQRKHEKLKTVKQSLLEKMFPKEGEDAPEIRFEGFTDPWEQRRLGEISESYSGGTPSVGNESYYGGDIPFIRSAEISSDSTELRLTEKGLDNSSAALVESGCVLYALYGATSGEVAISRIRGAINQAILAIVPSKNNNAEFIAAWLRREKPKILDTYLQGGQGNLSGAIVKDLTLALPSGEEQSRIGALFQKLDSLIALHQRELDILKNLKQALLEKMFV